MDKNRGILLFVVAFFSAVSAYAMTRGIMSVPILLDRLIGENTGGAFDLTIRATLGEAVFYINLTMICFLLLIAVLLIGFFQDRLYLSLGGTIAYFIPTLAHFTWGMGTLYGVGILRCLWGPSRELNQLVRIVDIPIRLYVGTELPIQENLHNALYDRLFFFSEAFIALGFFIFVFGIFNLLIGLFEEEGVVSFWLYKYIRHPQYLGYILWSYGIYARTNMVSNVFGYSRPNPFPWVISTLLIICIALHEENILRTEKSEYLNYSEETSFLVPTPKIVSSLFLYPFRVITKREYPDSIQDIALVFFIYLSIIILISLEASWMLRIET